MLNIPLLDPTLSGWCAHYGHTYLTYRLARLPLLDSLQDKALMCIMFPVDPAICLICGMAVCLRSDCCIGEDHNN